MVKGAESWLYRSAARLLGAVVTMAKRLQSGRLDIYLLHMPIVLVTVIATVAALPWTSGQRVSGYPGTSAAEGLAALARPSRAGLVNAATAANGPYQARHAGRRTSLDDER